MADVKVDGQYGYGQPTPVAPAPQGVAAPVAGAPKQSQYVQQTPTWVVVIRGFQVFFSLVTLGLAAYLMHGKVLDENAFALVCALFTWIVVIYTLVTEKVTSARGAYNIWAVMSLDLFMGILWLASMASNAALRGKFNVKVRTSGCYSTGSSLNSHYCSVYRRLVDKRSNAGALVSDRGLDIIAGIAGVSAIIMILFIATLVFHGHTFRLWHAANKTPSATNANLEANAQSAPMMNAQPQPYVQQTAAPAQQYQAPAVAPAYTPQPYPQQAELQNTYAPSPVGTPAPQQPFQSPQQQQQYGYPNPAQQQFGQQQQQTYSPQGTPAPGQPYYPPQQ
ncbi:hypothetical protein QBC43DRAFT_71422 [Cladorrhinum sp. PSN259]|nr:hypothetical protein QBC43DRAFT_71422 [Cladorrhinum sp. PSN259]